MHHEFAAESRKAFSGTLFYAFLIASLACFPLLGLGGGLLYLCVRYERLGEFNKNLLLLYIAITTSIVIGSKTYGIELDFVNYYSDYRAVLDDPDFLAGVLSNYGSGYEFVMPLSYWVLAKLNIDLNASKAMQIMTMIILVPFIYWAKDCQNISKLKDNKIVLICSILYISTIIYNQLFRQALSSIFILYSLSSRPSRKWLYLLMGTVVHLTTLPLYIIINFLLKRNYKAIIIVFILLYLIYYFGVSIIKLSTYNIDYNLNNIALDGIKWVIIAFLIYMAVAIKLKKFPCDECTKSFLFINILYVLLMPLGYMADRVLMVPILMINGIFIGNILGNINNLKFVYKIIFFLIIIKILNYSDIINNYYWTNYPMFNIEPFYYL